METELVISDLPSQARQVRASKEEIAQLADNIKKVGLQHPIIVTEGIVVEGLKRVAAFKLLKIPTIPAFVSTDYVELCERLTLQRPERDTDLPRAIELVKDLWPSRVEHGRSLRSVRRKGRNENYVTPRAMMGKAIGVGDNRAETLTQAVKYAQIEPEVALKLELMSNGKMSAGEFSRWFLRRPSPSLTGVASTEEVRMVMERGLRTIATAIEAMSKFGDASALTQAERQLIVQNISVQRLKFLQIGREIKRGLEMEMGEEK